MKYLNILYALMLLPFCSSAQNYRDDILAVNKTLMARSSYSLQLHYEIFLDKELNKAFEQRSMSIVRQGANLHMKQSSDMEVVDTHRYQFVIDHRHRVFASMQKNEEEVEMSSRNRIKTFGLIDTYVDTIVSAFQSIKVLLDNDEVVLYECTAKPGSEAAVIWVEIDKKLKMFRSLTTRYRQPRKVREQDNEPHQITLKIHYAGFSTAPVVQPAIFNEASYVVIKDKKIQGLARKYASYNYLNETHDTP